MNACLPEILSVVGDHFEEGDMDSFTALELCILSKGQHGSKTEDFIKSLKELVVLGMFDINNTADMSELIEFVKIECADKLFSLYIELCATCESYKLCGKLTQAITQNMDDNECVNFITEMMHDKEETFLDLNKGKYADFIQYIDRSKDVKKLITDTVKLDKRNKVIGFKGKDINATRKKRKLQDDSENDDDDEDSDSKKSDASSSEKSESSSCEESESSSESGSSSSDDSDSAESIIRG